VTDGEAVILGVDGISDFNALHRRLYDHEVQLYAFDILAMGGDDLRSLPLHLRKANLQQLLARRPDGISVASFERGEIGPDLFRAACWDRPYRGGRQKVLDQGEEPEPSRDGARAMTVFVYVNTGKQAGDKDHIKVFATQDAAEKWFEENDPEGVALEYEVLDKRAFADVDAPSGPVGRWPASVNRRACHKPVA